MKKLSGLLAKITGMLVVLGCMIFAVIIENIISFNDIKKAVDDKAVIDKINSSITTDIIIMICVVVFNVGCLIFCIIKITKPITGANKQLDVIIGEINDGRGDLSKKIVVKTKDETGRLAAGINEFILKLDNIINKIKEASQKIEESNQQIFSELGVSNEEASSISAVTEELSASMEEINNTMADLVKSAQTMLDTAESMNGLVEQGNDNVADMKNRANKVKNDCTRKREKINSVINQKRVEMSEAIEQSQKVNDIANLTDDILNIANQTNLLSLNASIEAARAGEAGRGFAVVAEEISQLAESSRIAANSIQELSGVVIESVKNLNSHSDEIMKYMSEDVERDYKDFIDMGDTYYNDANHMGEMLDNFTGNSNELKNASSVISGGISNISQSIEQCTKGIGDAANSVGNLVNLMSEINSAMDSNSSNIKNLEAETNKFV